MPAAGDQFQILVAANIGDRMRRQMGDLLHLFFAAFKLVEIHIHAIDAAVDKAAQKFSCRLENTGNSDRGRQRRQWSADLFDL